MGLPTQKCVEIRRGTQDATLVLELIPAGSFVMGASPPEGDTSGEAWQELLADETPSQHRYTLGRSRPAHVVVISKPFYIGAREVTQSEYTLVVGREPLEGVTPDAPEQAVWKRRLAGEQFFEKLNGMTGESFRLPTEAEWEYACRAGTGTTYCSGSDVASLDEYAWTCRNSDRFVMLPMDTKYLGFRIVMEVGSGGTE